MNRRPGWRLALTGVFLAVLLGGCSLSAFRATPTPTIDLFAALTALAPTLDPSQTTSDRSHRWMTAFNLRIYSSPGAAARPAIFPTATCTSPNAP